MNDPKTEGGYCGHQQPMPGRSAKEVLAWHRQVHKDLLKALRLAPSAWFTRRSRGPDWPFDADGHSAGHRVKDLEQGLLPRRK